MIQVKALACSREPFLVRTYVRTSLKPFLTTDDPTKKSSDFDSYQQRLHDQFNNRMSFNLFSL